VQQPTAKVLNIIDNVMLLVGRRVACDSTRPRETERPGFSSRSMIKNKRIETKTIKTIRRFPCFINRDKSQRILFFFLTNLMEDFLSKILIAWTRELVTTHFESWDGPRSKIKRFNHPEWKSRFVFIAFGGKHFYGEQVCLILTGKKQSHRSISIHNNKSF
jgi:hypothetical protein